MYNYSAEDIQRRYPEAPKKNQLVSNSKDSRNPFSRDRDRVLHSAALRRLADKTQVVGPRDGDTPRTRLTHSLEVAQISRGIGSGLGLDQDLSELAGLCHDIGHPPYGHNGEKALNEVAEDCGGFEGNAQTLRILTRLEPKIASEDGTSFGLNLTRAALDAAGKYPRTRTNPDGTINRKYGAYDEDAEILAWVRNGYPDARPSLEAQAMDFADDIAYSVHDVEDGIVSGRIDLRVLGDLFELAELARKGAEAFGGDLEELVEGAATLRELPEVMAVNNFDATLSSYVALKAMTSALVGRYVGSTIAATQKANTTLGRLNGQLKIHPEAEREVKLLKTLAVLYVMDSPNHLARQDRQRDRIFRVYDYLVLGAPGSLDPMFQQWYLEAETEAGRSRVVIDQIASLTESRLERLAKSVADISSYFS